MSQKSVLSRRVDRRAILSGAAASVASIAVSACTSVGGSRRVSAFAGDSRLKPAFSANPVLAGYRSMYGPMIDHGYKIPAVPIEEMDPRFLRRLVADPTGEPPGTVVVDTSNHFLYLVREGGEAMRYGVGLGREGFEWSGRAVIEWKQAWPTWTPPAEMIAREPQLAEFSADNGGMEPGLTNPLGARALYIFEDGVDTLYRVHGSPEWWSIGKSVSSGCVRLINQDIIDLYDRVPAGTPIMVTGNYPLTA